MTGRPPMTIGRPSKSVPHLILPAGTRIVTRNDANRIGGRQLIPTGAVAVITNSPADAQHAYKVRFNDGAEAMLRRSEFSILKEFKGLPSQGMFAGADGEIKSTSKSKRKSSDTDSPRPSDG